MKRLIVLITLVSIGLVPWLWGSATLLGINLCIWGLLALSLNILYGYTGLLSLGQGVYFALGAYGAAWAVIYGNVNFWGALGAGVLCALGGAVIAGWVSVRASGFGFVVVTLVTALICYLMALSFDGITGGEDGMSFRAPALALPGLALSIQNLSVRYYLALGALLAGLGIVYLVSKSLLGLAFRAVRDDEIAAASLGYDIVQIKLYAFVLAGAMAGLAGTVWSLSKEFVRAGLFQPFGAFLSAQPDPDPLIAVLLGGPGRLFGPLVGTGMLLALREFFAGVWPQGYALALGVVILGCVCKLCSAR
ncbi:MAG: branched-chain amino acid ABC transporter permease [Candidatus Bipolaricaulota bacterium]|nr:branched-chain amino acid ABC transporter permease [Candidatus Bipolaricaulota bacterium]